MDIESVLSPRIERLRFINGRLVSARTPTQQEEVRRAMIKFLGPVMPYLIPDNSQTIVDGKVVR